ncbi:hypothetical protein HDU97_004450 [Phlyctochytrium planicorne]|nr:hypothetical protein HDU97_004450 [Phlyctochytrium planicorne]
MHPHEPPPIHAKRYNPIVAYGVIPMKKGFGSVQDRFMCLVAPKALRDNETVFSNLFGFPAYKINEDDRASMNALGYIAKAAVEVHLKTGSKLRFFAKNSVDYKYWIKHLLPAMKKGADARGKYDEMIKASQTRADRSRKGDENEDWMAVDGVFRDHATARWVAEQAASVDGSNSPRSPRSPLPSSPLPQHHHLTPPQSPSPSSPIPPDGRPSSSMSIPINYAAPYPTDPAQLLYLSYQFGHPMNSISTSAAPAYPPTVAGRPVSYQHPAGYYSPGASIDTRSASRSSMADSINWVASPRPSTDRSGRFSIDSSMHDSRASNGSSPWMNSEYSIQQQQQQQQQHQQQHMDAVATSQHQHPYVMYAHPYAYSYAYPAAAAGVPYIPSPSLAEAAESEFSNSKRTSGLSSASGVTATTKSVDSSLGGSTADSQSLTESTRSSLKPGRIDEETEEEENGMDIPDLKFEDGKLELSLGIGDKGEPVAEAEKQQMEKESDDKILPTEDVKTEEKSIVEEQTPGFQDVDRASQKRLSIDTTSTVTPAAAAAAATVANYLEAVSSSTPTTNVPEVQRARTPDKAISPKESFLSNVVRRFAKGRNL